MKINANILRLRKKSILTISVLAFTLLIHGCAFQSILFDEEPDRRGFVLTKPPVQLTVYGAGLSDEDRSFIQALVAVAIQVPYKEYKFNETHSVILSTINSKSDNVDIDLSTTYAQPTEPEPGGTQ